MNSLPKPKEGMSFIAYSLKQPMISKMKASPSPSKGGDVLIAYGLKQPMISKMKPAKPLEELGGLLGGWLPVAHFLTSPR